MKVGYIECFAGISGDMLMGALVDAGAPFDEIRRAAASLGLGAELHLSRVDRSGIQAAKIDVLVDGHAAEAAVEHKHTHGRHLRQIREILEASSLRPKAKSLSLRAFDLLGESEARIHGISVEKVHFHEVGAVDAIVDIACASVAIEALNLDRWYCSPVNVGSGFVQCHHGQFPVPAPATADLLKNFLIYSSGPRMELTTPTGAALLRALDCGFESLPVIRSRSIGYGAGTRNPDGFPNVLRITTGESSVSSSYKHEKVIVIECSLDDLSPQVVAHAAQAALARGALDVTTTPVTMKKGRIGTVLTILCRPDDSGQMQELLFRETSTLGLRVREEDRYSLLREIVPVETEFGVISVKVGSWNGEELNVAPEFEDCRRAAQTFAVPLKDVMQAALAGWRRRSLAVTASETK